MVNVQFATSVHIMLSLALTAKGDCPKLPNSDVLAESIHTNPVVVRRLLSLLNKAGLIKSARGKNGGVQLNRAPSEINLKDIYVALQMEDSIKPHNKPQKKDCAVSCSIHSIMSSVTEGYQKTNLKFLESLKLSDLIKKVKINKA